jgi:DNA (cytosine-5)-methyltransferase 1
MPRLLDAFSGAGGCARGYQRAGFHVTGVDLAPQPRYAGDEFVQGDALEYVAEHGHEFDAIHASPPCQAYSTMGQRFPEAQAKHPDLIEPTRDRIIAAGLPYVIENVGGARNQMRDPYRLCGSSFGLGVHRHRLFETSFPMLVPECAHVGDGVPVYGKLDGRRLWTRTDGSELRAPKTLDEGARAMGIDWMEWAELTQAIPPAMTEFIGHYLMAAVNARAAA